MENTLDITSIKRQREDILKVIENLKNSNLTEDQQHTFKVFYNNMITDFDEIIKKHDEILGLKVVDAVEVNHVNKALQHKINKMQCIIDCLKWTLSAYNFCYDKQNSNQQNIVSNLIHNYLLTGMCNKVNDCKLDFFDFEIAHTACKELRKNLKYPEDKTAYWYITPNEIINWEVSKWLQFHLIRWLALRPRIKHLQRTINRLENELQELYNAR